jgi:CubicO group peptidase (beta-lactamase class C family)
MKKYHVAGLSLGIVKNGKVMVSKGYGFANLDDSIPATEKTIFKLGSLSKQFIATAIMVLAEQGKVNLSDYISKYYKDAPVEWRNITIRNLLNHTSGLERESPAFNPMIRQPDSLLIQAAYKDTLLFPTGSNWEYSNLGYFILADIIRKVSGNSFEDYMNTFFSTCGLAQTTTTTKSIGHYKATGYYYNKTTGLFYHAFDMPALRPSGAFSSSLVDMIKWDSIQRLGYVLTLKDWKKMWTDTVKTNGSMGVSFSWNYYGYGWGVGKIHGHNLVAHGGYTPGFTTEYWKFMDDSLSIILLTNADDTRTPQIFIDKIAIKIFNALRPGLEASSVSITSFDKYYGVYSDTQSSMKITITEDEYGLAAQATGQSSFPLEYIAKDKFKFESGKIEIDFDTGKNELILKQWGQNFIFTKDKRGGQ